MPNKTFFYVGKQNSIFSLHIRQILRDFPVPRAGSLGRDDNEARWRRDFEPLVNVLLDKYQNGGRSAEGEDALRLPATLEEVHREFRVVHPLPSIGKEAGMCERGEREAFSSCKYRASFVVPVVTQEWAT